MATLESLFSDIDDVRDAFIDDSKGHQLADQSRANLFEAVRVHLQDHIQSQSNAINLLELPSAELSQSWSKHSRQSLGRHMKTRDSEGSNFSEDFPPENKSFSSTYITDSDFESQKVIFLPGGEESREPHNEVIRCLSGVGKLCSRRKRTESIKKTINGICSYPLLAHRGRGGQTLLL